MAHEAKTDFRNCFFRRNRKPFARKPLEADLRVNGFLNQTGNVGANRFSVPQKQFPRMTCLQLFEALFWCCAMAYFNRAIL